MSKSTVTATPVAATEPVTPVKVDKVYTITAGRLPEANQKALGLHAVIITEAITALTQAGATQATRATIMAKAVELGLFTKKPTVQKEPAIFAWWRKPLAELGWLKY
jgi:hypothetical protein